MIKTNNYFNHNNTFSHLKLKTIVPYIHVQDGSLACAEFRFRALFTKQV